MTENINNVDLTPEVVVEETSVEREGDVREVIKALCKAIPNYGEIKKDKRNPHFNSEYASLDSIIPAIQKPLAEQGLCILHTFQPSKLDNKVEFVTTLFHAHSGQCITSTLLISFPYNIDNKGLQAFGSVITYLKRYSISALLCLSVDEDDDGNSANLNNDSYRASSPKPATKPMYNAPKPAASPSGAEMADAKDFSRLKTLREELGLTTEEGLEIIKTLGYSRAGEIEKHNVEVIINLYKEYAQKR